MTHAPPGTYCDVGGCGAVAELRTTGGEVDHEERPAIPRLNVCRHHFNWPHSDDAKAAVERNANAYQSRK